MVMLKGCEASGFGAMRVLMAPDFREGNPYQRLLSEALAVRGVEAEFPVGYHRVMPLVRSLRGHKANVLHLHWAEAYYREARDGLDWLRAARFPWDLDLACRRMPLVATAHNLYPHNRQRVGVIRRAAGCVYRRARRVIVHGVKIPGVLVNEFGVDPERCRYVPHGDLSVVLPEGLPKAEARRVLGLDVAGPLCLMFGSVEPYKGIKEVVEFWCEARPEMKLVVVGMPRDEEYASEVGVMAGRTGSVEVRFAWLDDQALANWLSAADVVVFNYRAILVSGAATLARSLGKAIVLPERLETIDLEEPHPLVFRFDDLRGNFLAQIESALAGGSRPDLAAEWRAHHAWDNVARLTREVYDEAVVAG